MYVLLRLFTLALLAVLLSSIGIAYAETRVELPDGAIVTTHSAIAAAQDDGDPVALQWIALADRGDFALLETQVAAAGRGIAAELARSALVRYLQDSPAGRSAGAGELLEAIALRQPLVWVRHAETRGDWFVPALDAGGDARWVLELLAMERARMGWLQRLQADPEKALTAGFADQADARRAAEALGMAPQAVVQTVLAQGAASKRELPGPVLVALAERAPGIGLYRRAIAAAQPAERVALVASLPSRLAAEPAQALLRKLSGDAAVGSTAVLALGRYAADSPKVRDWLLDALGDPRLGTSAASALARFGGAGLVEALQSRAGKSGDSALLRDVALALRLHGSPAAHAALQALSRDPRVPDALRRELQR